MLAQRQDVLGSGAARARPQPGPRPSRWNDRDGARQARCAASSSASSLAREVDSHGASMSVRPKWAYTAVWRNEGRRRFSSLMIPSGLRAKVLLTARATAAV